MRKKMFLTATTTTMLLLAACGSTETTSTSEGTASIVETKETTTEEATTKGETTEETEEETEAEKKENEKINLEVEDGKLEYVSHEIVQDYEGKPTILIHFNFTNNSDKSTSAQLLFHPKVFQNGVECEFGILMDAPEAYQNLSKEIQPGTTLEVAFPYVLTDTTNPVDVEVSSLTDWLADEQKQTITLR